MQTTPSPVKYQSPTANREAIETDLSNLRTRNHGFVRKESLRLTPPLDSKKDDVQYRHKNRWRRRRRRECDNNGGNNLIEKFEAAIKTRVLELRLIGRRSWWPQHMWSKSKHINTSRHAINMHQKLTSDNVNSNKRIVSKRQSMNIEGAQYTTKELIKRFDKCDSSILVVQKQSKKKIKWKFWIQKEKRTMKPDEDDETTIVVDTRDDMDQIIDDVDTTRDGPSKEGEEENLESIISRLEKEIRQMRVGKDKGKKTKKRIAEIMAGATVSTLGVVVAIILL